jgi:hypothetical protein
MTDRDFDVHAYDQGYRDGKADAVREADRLRTVLKELREFADKERWNTAQLLSNPPQSSAAWNIRNAIDAALGDEK